MKLIAFNGKASTKLFLTYIQWLRLHTEFSSMSAGTSLKAAHSCYRSFQPLPENSKQKTYSSVLPWLLWFRCSSAEKKLDCIQWQSCRQAVLVKLPSLRDYLLPKASELRNLCGPLQIVLIHLLFVALPCFVFTFLYIWITWSKIGKEGKCAFTTLSLCTFFALLMDQHPVDQILGY